MTVYVVQAVDGGPVKIGYYSGALAYPRVWALQIGNPKELRLCEQIDTGTSHDETAIHRALADFRLRGEWFRVSAPIEDCYVFRYFRAFSDARLADPEDETALTAKAGRRRAGSLLLHEVNGEVEWDGDGTIWPSDRALPPPNLGANHSRIPSV